MILWAIAVSCTLTILSVFPLFGIAHKLMLVNNVGLTEEINSELTYRMLFYQVFLIDTPVLSPDLVTFVTEVFNIYVELFMLGVRLIKK